MARWFYEAWYSAWNTECRMPLPSGNRSRSEQAVLKSNNAEQTALGAWASATVAIGIFPRLETALQQAKQTEDIVTYLPDTEWSAVYAEKRSKMNRFYRILY